jgi:hypothetical protein
MRGYGVRKGTMGAVLLASTLLGPLSAAACERHAKPAAAASSSQEPSHGEHSREAEAPAQLSAKCSCESKADCTCKKGQCRCDKCKKGRHGATRA